MTIDIAGELGATSREVGTATVGGAEGRFVRLSRTFDSRIDDVWDAFASPERLGRWFLPVTGDFRLGGRYQFEGNAGGEILECDKPHRFKVTWVYGETEGAGASEVEVRLTPASDGATTLDFVHTAVVPDEMWDTFGPGAVGVGWDGGLLGLSLYLASGATVEDPEAWQLSEEGRDFNTRSSAAWGEALRATGVDDETVARNVAATTAFYAPPAE